ncbi:homoserine kinase [Clostridium sp. DL1XJH146]
MFRIKVPATTANMGPGFDSFGMALGISNVFEFEEIDKGFEFYIEGKETDIAIEDNLIFNTLFQVLNKYNYSFRGIKLNISECPVPLSRGLGSSATCIVAAVLAANILMDGKMTQEEIIEEIVQAEGHPDNVVPALLGGMVVSMMADEKVIYSEVKVPDNISFVVMIPNFKTSTEEAREVLPEKYTREECVYNHSRTAMLVNAFNTGKLDNLRLFMMDKIHQEYRKKLITNSDLIFEKSKEFGALAEFVSGSGSTLISIIKNDDCDFIDKMTEFLSGLDDEWKIIKLKPDYEGATLFKCEV